MDAENRLVIDSRLEAVAEARAWVAERASQAGFPSDAIGDLELAVTEAVANVVCHAYGGEPGHEIILSLDVDEEALTLTIRDFARRQFDGNCPTPVLNGELMECGYGVLLIRETMDEVCYDTSAEIGTTLTLVKRRGDNPPPFPGTVSDPSTDSGQDS
jgi:anti-sigma regulatory factor (Ser/Thr protein kinase)